MTPDTPETIYAALDDLTRRVAAFEKAQAQADVGPPMLTEEQYIFLVPTKYSDAYMPPNAATRRVAAARLRYLESAHARLREENAALRERLKPYPEDHPDCVVRIWASEPYPNGCMAREVLRKRGLTLDGAK